MTPAEIILHRRVAEAEHAQETGDVADRYGLDALAPKARRTPQMPDAPPTHVVQALWTVPLVEPTIGCRQ